MRAIMRIFATTYGESVSSTPTRDIGESSGPMLNGSTYMVRPRIAFRNRPLSVRRMT